LFGKSTKAVAVGLSRAKPSTDWSQGGPIIDGWSIDLTCDEYLSDNERWLASCTNEAERFSVHGQTPLIAAMRCYVASKLGDEVDIPDDLCK
jgi:Protein of unknown function (DUF2591)